MDNETTIDTVELDETSETSLAKELTNTVLTVSYTHLTLPTSDLV